MAKVFDTHKFLFTINYQGDVKGKKVIFVDRNNEEKSIILEKIEIGASPVSCKLYDIEGNRYLVLFIRIKKVFDGKTLIWDNCDIDISDAKIIKGYK